MLDFHVWPSLDGPKELITTLEFPLLASLSTIAGMPSTWMEIGTWLTAIGPQGCYDVLQINPIFKLLVNIVILQFNLIKTAYNCTVTFLFLRFLRSEHNSPENLIYEYDDFYFITEPDQLCLTHYPEDPVWLLLKAPILTKEKFEEYPLLKSYFFTSGMHLLNDCSLGVAHAKYGEWFRSGIYFQSADHLSQSVELLLAFNVLYCYFYILIFLEIFYFILKELL